MSDTIPNDAAHPQEWRRRYQAAIMELEPAKLLKRIAEARSTIFDQIEDSFSKPSDPEHVALRNALETLSTLPRPCRARHWRIEKDRPNTEPRFRYPLGQD